MHRFRDPAMLTQFAGAAIGLLVAFNFGVTDEQAALWLTAIMMAVSAVSAALVKPWSPSILTGLISSAAALTAGYGFEIGAERVAAVNLFVSMAIAMWFMRPNSTPKSDPAIGQGVTSKDVGAVHRVTA